ALHVSNRADYELSRIGAKLNLITGDSQHQSSKLSISKLAEVSQRESDSGSDEDTIAKRKLNISSNVPLVHEREELANSIRQQERNEPGTWYEIARQLNSTLDFNTVLQRVMDLVIRFVNAERGFLMLLNSETKEPRITIARDELLQPIVDFSTISQQTIRDVIRTREPMLDNDTQT